MSHNDITMIVCQNKKGTYKIGGRLFDRLAERSSVGGNNKESKKGVKKLHGGN